jgi:adenine deaminase
MTSFEVVGQLVDIFSESIYPAKITVDQGKIASIQRGDFSSGLEKLKYIMPGFIDAHVHVESSLCVPSEFARLAVVHGTVATVSDPHEIANVLGIDGIRYMQENAKQVPFKFYFGASSCVPATLFETAGASLSLKEIEELFQKDGLKYLSEMMNYPGVLSRDHEVMAKIELAKRLRKPIDGHAPGLKGLDAKHYIDAGISTDHECFMLDEAEQKIQNGMKVIIRQGTAAKNFEALAPLFKRWPHKLMLCSDDKHADDLVRSHINEIVRRAVWEKRLDLMAVLKAATLIPVQHYGLDVGLLRVGDPADFIVVDDLHDFIPSRVFINGKCVAKEGKSLIERTPVRIVNHFATSKKEPKDFQVKAEGATLRVIEAIDGELITKSLEVPVKTDQDGSVIQDRENDILKIVVVNRYKEAPCAVGFIKNFGLKQGAICSSVAHDSHNIIAVGCDDSSLAEAVNLVIEAKGGLAAASGEGENRLLRLPVAGLMSDQDGWEVAREYEELQKYVKEKLGTTLASPFMTLSFMALLVIPELKMSDKGLFDGKNFRFTPLTF